MTVASYFEKVQPSFFLENYLVAGVFRVIKLVFLKFLCTLIDCMPWFSLPTSIFLKKKFSTAAGMPTLLTKFLIKIRHLWRIVGCCSPLNFSFSYKI